MFRAPGVQILCVCFHIYLPLYFIHRQRRRPLSDSVTSVAVRIESRWRAGDEVSLLRCTLG